MEHVSTLKLYKLIPFTELVQTNATLIVRVNQHGITQLFNRCKVVLPSLSVVSLVLFVLQSHACQTSKEWLQEDPANSYDKQKYRVYPRKNVEEHDEGRFHGGTGLLWRQLGVDEETSPEKPDEPESHVKDAEVSDGAYEDEQGF